MRLVGLCVTSLLLTSAGLSASAQSDPQEGSYPARPIRLIVPVPVGGSTDIVARIVAAKLSVLLQQQMVIDNRAGAGGIIGTEMVAKATPDGYTFLFAYASHTITPFLGGTVPYDAALDFAAVSQVTTQPLVLVANAALPVSSVKELIAFAKSRPGQVRAGAPGMGGTGHIATEIFKLETGADIPTIIYKGGGPAQLALLQGEVHLVFASAGAAMPQIKTGKVKVLATSSARRLAYLPEIPTFVEAGLPNVSVSPWQGILAPAKTPRSIIDKLQRAVASVLKQPDTIERLAATGSDPVGGTPEELTAKIRKELDHFGRVIKAANIRIE
jgi:tripartite-type tricarboxylate transporter receptor subunit TctC